MVQIALDSGYYSQVLINIMFKKFIDNNEFNEIIAFADRRWICNEEHNVYTDLGFKRDSLTKPQCSFFSSKTNRLQKIDKPKVGRNYLTIFDCGKVKYVFNR